MVVLRPPPLCSRRILPSISAWEEKRGRREEIALYLSLNLAFGAISSPIHGEKKGVWLGPRILEDAKEHGADARDYIASILRISGVAEGDE